MCFVKGFLWGIVFFFLLMYFFTNVLVHGSCVDEVRVVFVERFCQLALAFDWESALVSTTLVYTVV